MRIGENIFRLRTARGLSQGELAERLDVSRQSVSKWENGAATPDLDKLVKLDFSHNQVVEIPLWDQSCALVTIDGSYNLIETLEPLAGLNALNNVLMDYNEAIESVEELAECPNLIQVNVFGTAVTDASMLTEQSIIVNFDPTAGAEEEEE